MMHDGSSSQVQFSKLEAPANFRLGHIRSSSSARVTKSDSSHWQAAEHLSTYLRSILSNVIDVEMSGSD
jgi:hypothetical protein